MSIGHQLVIQTELCEASRPVGFPTEVRTRWERVCEASQGHQLAAGAHRWTDWPFTVRQALFCVEGSRRREFVGSPWVNCQALRGKKKG